MNSDVVLMAGALGARRRHHQGLVVNFDLPEDFFVRSAALQVLECMIVLCRGIVGLGRIRA